jgi:hypothetical protein
MTKLCPFRSEVSSFRMPVDAGNGTDRFPIKYRFIRRKQNMKKLLAFVLVMALSLSLAACGGTETTTTTAAPADDGTTTTTAAPADDG